MGNSKQLVSLTIDKIKFTWWLVSHSVDDEQFTSKSLTVHGKISLPANESCTIGGKKFTDQSFFIDHSASHYQKYA